MASLNTKKLTLENSIFTRAVDDIITKDELAGLLGSGRSFRIKHGIDATSSDLHIGHAVSLWKIRELQEYGHKAVILLGDITTQIGDPTGKFKARPTLSETEIEKNINSIKKQVEKILLISPKVYEIHKSSEWYRKMNVPELLRILSLVTHARLIERDMFKVRIRTGSEIFMHEFIYPVLQGYDSYALGSDLTIIGSDQIFNEHVGRFFQEKLGKMPQAIVALKVLPGLGGGEKMSKSSGNAIALEDTPSDKFGKAMRVLDSLILSYLEAYTDVPYQNIEKIKRDLLGGMNPMKAKIFLAEALVRRYHGSRRASLEKKRFEEIFSKKTFGHIPVAKLKPGSYEIIGVLLRLGFAKSRTEARRLLLQDAVEINGRVVSGLGREINIKEGDIIKVGKRRFVKIT